jgi:hypothetical protein
VDIIDVDVVVVVVVVVDDDDDENGGVGRPIAERRRRGRSGTAAWTRCTTGNCSTG